MRRCGRGGGAADARTIRSTAKLSWLGMACEITQNGVPIL
jgi:hypothetical protein